MTSIKKHTAFEELPYEPLPDEHNEQRKNKKNGEAKNAEKVCFVVDKKKLPPESAIKQKRQVIKVHGVSRDPDGNLLFAVSFAKAKTFHYLTNEEMKTKFPNYLIGFYERHIKNPKPVRKCPPIK